MRYRLAAALVALLALAALAAPTPADDKDAKVEVGKPAPPIDLPATNIGSVLPDKKGAKSLSLADLKGKNVVLFFYPKALTSGCTIQSCGFRDRVKDFAKLDTVVIGISTDPVALQQKFTDTNELNFPLFADADKKVAREYGVLTARGMAARTTFVIDKKGVVRKVYNNANAKGNPEEVLRYVRDSLAAK
jgi:peroxiredoxin Q/BCP